MNRSIRRLVAVGAALAFQLFFVGGALAQGPLSDYGDAPEGSPAYPWTGVMGKFPTCFGGPYGYIRHQPMGNPSAFFGPLVDYENDGNAGACPPPPYQNDECHLSVDDDAGIGLPTSYSISAANQPVACTPGTRTSLGPPCGLGDWGTNLNILTTNMSPNPVYFNVVVDWNQDGQWGGSGACPAGASKEHIVADFPVPPGFSGPISGLALPPFRIGSLEGFVWVRMSLTEVPIGANWDGNGRQASYLVGETEDYLLKVGSAFDQDAEFGDAPEGALAYPPLGVMGQFPTCTSVGAAGTFIAHVNPTNQLRLGGSLDIESDGNDGDCLWTTYNNDECNLANGDAGFFGAAPQTISGGLIVGCPGSNGAPLGSPCSNATWGPNGDLVIVNQTNAPGYLNGLIDWGQDGSWGGAAPCPGFGAVPEWVLQNIGVPPGYVGLLSGLFPPPYRIGKPGFVWARFTLSDQPVTIANWDGAGVANTGETEDYLLYVAEASSVPDSGRDGHGRLNLEPSTPNPFLTSTSVVWWQPESGPARVTIHDLQGRLVTTLVDGERSQGRHELLWDGRDATKQQTGAGLYLVRVQTGGGVETKKVVRAR